MGKVPETHHSILDARSLGTRANMGSPAKQDQAIERSVWYTAHDQALTNRYLKRKRMYRNEFSGQTNVINSNNITYDKDQGYCAQISLNTDKDNIEAVRRTEKRSRRKHDREPSRIPVKKILKALKRKMLRGYNL